MGRYLAKQISMNSVFIRAQRCSARPLPVLPYIVTFQVERFQPRRGPCSVICALSLENLLHKPNSDVAKEISRLEIELAKEEVHLDVYRFTELDYAVLSLPVD
jgi:hypothetical protein